MLASFKKISQKDDTYEKDKDETCPSSKSAEMHFWLEMKRDYPNTFKCSIIFVVDSSLVQ